MEVARMTHLDGNVLAGPLSELFSADLTDASGRCLACGDEAVLAQAMVYISGMGAVARCRSCDSVLLSIVETADGSTASLSGLGMLRIRS
jgi:hypothetical protein